jgi:hypothetical protein
MRLGYQGERGTLVKFYLGTHLPSWLKRTQVPLFISHTRLSLYQTLPRAAGHWALDSGAYSELNKYGQFRYWPTRYAEDVRDYLKIGGLDWASPQDWMCEPWVLRQTGLTVNEHLRRTVGNFIELTHVAPDLPFIPVIQGWKLGDYFTCVDMYHDSGIDLMRYPTVGVGSVCRRQSTDEIRDIMVALSELGLRLHGFGVKTDGLRKYSQHMVSCDSMAWSAMGRNHPQWKGQENCRETHKNCANCFPFALRWRETIVGNLIPDDIRRIDNPSELASPAIRTHTRRFWPTRTSWSLRHRNNLPDT